MHGLRGARGRDSGGDLLLIGLLLNVLLEDRARGDVGLQVLEAVVGGDGGIGTAPTRDNVAADLPRAKVLHIHRAGDGAVGSGADVGLDRRCGLGAERIAREPAGDIASARVGVEEQRGGLREAVVGVEHTHSHGVGQAVREQAGKGGEVDAIGLQVEGLDAGDGLPQVGVETAGVDPGVDGSDTGRNAVDGDLGFAESGVAIVLQRTGDARGHVRVPELIGGLRLRDDVQVSAGNIARQARKCDALLIGEGVEEGGLVAAGQAKDGGRDCGRRIGGVCRVEEQSGRAVDAAVVGGVIDVAEERSAGLCCREEGTVVGEVALHVP